MLAGKLFRDDQFAPLAHLTAPLGIAKHFDDSFGHLSIVTRGNNKARLAFDNRFTHATYVRGDNRQPGGHVLENGVCKTFRLGNEYADMRSSQQPADVFTSADEQNIALDAKLPGELLEVLHQVAFAGYNEPCVGDDRTHTSRGA